MKHRFTDIHHHLAFGVDDGPKSRKQMQKMLKYAEEEGIGAIVATPHATPGVERFPLEEYRQALADARAYCAEKGLEIKLYEGCEILYTDQTPRILREGQLPTMRGSDFVLVEFSPDIKFSKLREALDKLLMEGYRPIIAHCERYSCLTKHPSRVEKLKDELEVRFQINCSSIIKNKGLMLRRFVKHMLKDQLADALGTDAHNVSSRAANMKEAYKIVKRKYGGKYARRLTDGSVFED